MHTPRPAPRNVFDADTDPDPDPRPWAVGLWPLLLALLALFTPAGAHARQITVPISVDANFLRRSFVTQVFTAADESVRVWDDGTGCNFLELRSPEVGMRDGRIAVTSAAQARAGFLLFGICLTFLDWDGFVEVLEQPELEPGTTAVGFRVVDSNLYGTDHQKQLASGVLWDWVKDYVHPRLSTVRLDFGGPLADVRMLLPLWLPGEDAGRVDAILDSLALADLRTSGARLALDLRFDVPPSGRPLETPSPEPTLTAEEVAAWQDAFPSWDGFLTFVIKQAAADATTGEITAELFSILIEGRYDLIEALAPTAAHEKDPVRELFVDSWKRLGPVMRRVGDDLPPDSALHYIGFIAATDALAALDELGPDVGLEISSDGLRRLARIVGPDAVADPLEFNYEVDRELRRLGGFGPPLETPPPNPDVDISHWTDWLLPRAWAGLPPEAVARLNRWVPSRGELDDYLPLVRELLVDTAARTEGRRGLEPSFQQTYRWLILAVAWQESCWRQFVRQGQTIKPITSVVGAVGLMQVNQRVWRGMYDVKGLRGDIGYNARAGAEIALHYLADYAVKRGEHKSGGDAAARATYSIYNGGPGALKRWRNPKASREGKKIDAAFFEKYRAVKAGREMEVAKCWG